MAALVELFGGSLVRAGGLKQDTSAALAGKGAIAVYFSAHWCPPCRGFTPKMAAWYTKDLKAKGLEVVFVSSDNDEKSFNEYFKEQPWLALPFEDRARKEELSKKFKVQGIPTLVILDSDGKVITKDGRSAVSEDPTGTEFPWKPTPLQELLASAKLVGPSGETTIQKAMEGKKALGLYFSAHWCPPCRGFTPQLADWYNKDLKAKGLEVVFVSSDNDESAFKSYFAEQPWLALVYEDRRLKEKLSGTLKVQGIPTLAILDSELNLVTTDGRSAVAADPRGADLPWPPKPVQDLKNGPGGINGLPTLLIFCEGCDAAEQASIRQALEPIAEKYIEKQKATGDDLEMSFMVATESEDLVKRVRGLLKLTGTATRMALLDIPDSGGYYLAAEGTAMSTAAVEEFVASYIDKNLDRQQLS